MKGIANLFVLAGVVSALAGMVWGIQMAASGDHTLSPAHGHLNLVGWVSLMLFGIYYHAVPAAAASALARLHLVVAMAGVILLVPGIAIAIASGSEPLAIAGSFVTLASMVIFGIVVLRTRTT